MLITSLFSQNYKREFLELEEEKLALVQKYEIKVEIARIERMYERVAVLNETLQCFKHSRSKFEIKLCKIDEQKRILTIIKKG